MKYALLTSAISQISEMDEISQKLNSILAQLDDIVSNTSIFGPIDNWFNTFLTWGSAAVTIVIAFQIGRRRIYRKTQHNIILDLMRHLMVNSAILENIIPKIGTSKPIEGTLSRFATLDNDLELSRFHPRARYYKELHNASLKIRNYNLMAAMTDKHMHTPGYPIQQLLEELNSLNERAMYIVLSLLQLSKKMYRRRHLVMDDFVEYILVRYEQPPYQSSRTNFCCPFFASGKLGATYEHLIEKQSYDLIMMS